jgi:hypothetical protein
MRQKAVLIVKTIIGKPSSPIFTISRFTKEIGCGTLGPFSQIRDIKIISQEKICCQITTIYPLRPPTILHLVSFKIYFL